MMSCNAKLLCGFCWMKTRWSSLSVFMVSPDHLVLVVVTTYARQNIKLIFINISMNILFKFFFHSNCNVFFSRIYNPHFDASWYLYTVTWVTLPVQFHCIDSSCSPQDRHDSVLRLSKALHNHLNMLSCACRVHTQPSASPFRYSVICLHNFTKLLSFFFNHINFTFFIFFFFFFLFFHF